MNPLSPDDGASDDSLMLRFCDGDEAAFEMLYERHAADVELFLREAVLLHKLDGLAFPEVAVALGTTLGAAKVLAHRGYQRLRVLLASWENHQ